MLKTHEAGRGRPKELDGTVDINDLRSDVFVDEPASVDGDDFTLHSVVVKSKSLKRKIKALHDTALYQHIRQFIEDQKSENSENNVVLSDLIPPNLLFFGVRESA